LDEIIEAECVKKIYETGPIRVDALRGISLAVKRGEMVGVIGPSGCGKTTLLNCLSGIDDLTEGVVRIEGTDIHKLPDGKRSEFRAKKMGFIFQAYNLLPVLTAVENVELPLLISKVESGVARKKALETLGLVGLGERENYKPNELSGGQQQRVAIARSIANAPAIVWGDEPTGNLDTENSLEIVQLLRRLNKEINLTLILVTHDPAVARMADKVIAMRDGAIEKIVDPSSLGGGRSEVQPVL